MTYSKEIKKIYSQLLGKSLKTKMNELGIYNNQIASDNSEDDFNFISESAVGEILKGRRNLTKKSFETFQSTLNYKTPREVFSQALILNSNSLKLLFLLFWLHHALNKLYLEKLSIKNLIKI